MLRISFVEINSFFSIVIVFQYWSFLIFDDLRVEFLISSFSEKNYMYDLVSKDY